MTHRSRIRFCRNEAVAIAVATGTCLLGTALAPTLGSAASASRESLVIEVPMSFYGTRPVIEVRVNGQGPFLFLIDTGAQGLARADSSLVGRLGLTFVGQDSSSDASASVKRVLHEVVFEELAIGTVHFRNVRALSRNYNTSDYLPHIDGILGFDLFSKFLLTLDYPGKRIRLSRGSLPKADGADVLELQRIEGNPYIEIRLGPRIFKALVDSGNIRDMDVPASIIRRLPLATYPKLVGRGGSVSGTFELREVRLQDSLRIGRHSVETPSVTFTDVYEEINLGSSLLRSFVVTFDQENGRVRFTKPGTGSEARAR
jgi:hypothetical protein